MCPVGHVPYVSCRTRVPRSAAREAYGLPWIASTPQTVPAHDLQQGAVVGQTQGMSGVGDAPLAAIEGSQDDRPLGGCFLFLEGALAAAAF